MTGPYYPEATPHIPFHTRGVDCEIWGPLVVMDPKMIQLGKQVRIDSFVKLEGGQGLLIADYVHIASFAHISIGGGKVEIGEGAAICSGGKVLSGSNTAQGYYMSIAAPRDLQHVDRRFTSIGRGAFVATNAVILPGVTVGEFAVIGAGAVVTKDVPPREFWAGVPARKIADRLTAEERAEILSGVGFVR